MMLILRDFPSDHIFGAGNRMTHAIHLLNYDNDITVSFYTMMILFSLSSWCEENERGVSKPGGT